MKIDPALMVLASSAEPEKSSEQYVVVWIGKHLTLKVGDVVIMGRLPSSVSKNGSRVLVRLSDHTLHNVKCGQDGDGTPVFLCRVADVENADAPATI